MILHNDIFLCLRENSDFGNLIDYAVMNGLYFKEKNNPYWYPSLNAGIPLTTKPDVIHQSIYVLHDVVHCVLPDPLPSTTKPLYVLSKILGEIASNIIADGYGAHILAELGINYNFSTRKVYPLFKAILDNGYFLEETLFLMFRFVAQEVIFQNGRESLYTLVSESNRGLVDEYFDKYNYFFDTDIVWNFRNYTNFFEGDQTFFSDRVKENANLLKNEHYFHSSEDSLYTYEDVIVLFITHMDEVLAGDMKAKGNGKALGDLLSQYEIANLPSVYPHIRMQYGLVDWEEVVSVRNYLKSHYTIQEVV